MRIKVVVKWGTCSKEMEGSTLEGEIREGFTEEVTDRGMSRTHQEKWDGRGNAFGKREESI